MSQVKFEGESSSARRRRQYPGGKFYRSNDVMDQRFISVSGALFLILTMVLGLLENNEFTQSTILVILALGVASSVGWALLISKDRSNGGASSVPVRRPSLILGEVELELSRMGSRESEIFEAVKVDLESVFSEVEALEHSNGGTQGLESKINEERVAWLRESVASEKTSLLELERVRESMRNLQGRQKALQSLVNVLGRVG